MCLFIFFINEEKLYFVIVTSVIKEKTPTKTMWIWLSELKIETASIDDCIR